MNEQHITDNSPAMRAKDVARYCRELTDKLQKEGASLQDSTELFEAKKEERKWMRRIEQLKIAHEEHDAEFEINDRSNRNVPYAYSDAAQNWYNNCKERRIKAGVPIWEPLSGILGVRQLGFGEARVFVSQKPTNYESIPLPRIKIDGFVIGGGDSFLGYLCNNECYDDVLYIWSLDQMYILGKDLLWKELNRDKRISVLNDVSVFCGQGPIA